MGPVAAPAGIWTPWLRLCELGDEVWCSGVVTPKKPWATKKHISDMEIRTIADNKEIPQREREVSDKAFLSTVSKSDRILL